MLVIQFQKINYNNFTDYKKLTITQKLVKLKKKLLLIMIMINISSNK